MRLILFDIDGTLIDSGGAGTRSLNNAFQELFSLENAFHGIRMAGKTDTEIIKEALFKHGISKDGTLDDVVSAYLENLEKEIQNNRKHIKPGVYELLEHLSSKKDIGLGLLTGNLEPGARIKLKSLDLDRYFTSGAFGSDDEDRNNLLPIAVKRFEELFQKRIEIDNCIIVGDTPRDVACAHIYHALCIGVATGPYSFEELVEAGADFVVKDLSDYSELLGFF
jgi:phosphoglycolate phosphatase-like HAD superfamily hydrolase